MNFRRIVIVFCLLTASLSTQEQKIQGSMEGPLKKSVRRGRQVNIISIISTTTTTETVSTSTICAKLVNVTGACFRVRNKWINEPIVLSFDEDVDEIDKLFFPPDLEPIEITSQPVELVQKTVTVQEPDGYAEDEYDEEDRATIAPFNLDFMGDQTKNMFQNYMHHLNESGFSMVELLSAVGEIFDRAPEIESSIPSHDRRPQIQPDIVDLFSHVVASLDGVTGNQTPPKKHRQKRQGPAGIFLIFLQILFFAVTSSGFGGNFANIFPANGQDQEVEQQTPNTNIPAPQTEYYTSTSTETETVYTTTTTKTIFIQNCTPNPLPYGECARRRDLQS